MVILVTLIVKERFDAPALPEAVAMGMRWSVLGCLWITMGLTVISGTSFFWRHREVLKDAVTR